MKTVQYGYLVKGSQEIFRTFQYEQIGHQPTASWKAYKRISARN